MPYLTTGLIDNTSTSRSEQTSRVSIKIANEDRSTVAVQIEGFLQTGTTKVKYVDEFFTLSAGNVAFRNYYTLFDAFEFQFFISSQDVYVSVLANDEAGKDMSTFAVMVIDKDVNYSNGET